MTPSELEALLRQYYETLDEALEALARGREGKLAELPSFALTTRDIHFGITPDGAGVLIKVIPSSAHSADRFTYRDLRTAEDIVALAAPIGLLFRPPGSLAFVFASAGGVTEDGLRALSQHGAPLAPEQLATWPFVMMGEASAYGPGQNPLVPPVVAPTTYLGFGRTRDALPKLTAEAARAKAIELWNAVVTGAAKTSSGSFVQQLREVFTRFSSIVKRKSFLERRIHRFLNDHRGLMLPSFTSCLFDHPLYLGTEERKADFVLEREAGLPALLIELESPHHKVFRANGHLAAAANHAVAQIADWVRIIDQDAMRNASGAYSFLAGAKDRLVIIGRGLEHRDQLLMSRFAGTTIWTYDTLLEQARLRWNSQLAEQRRVLRLPEGPPL